MVRDDVKAVDADDDVGDRILQAEIERVVLEEDRLQSGRDGAMKRNGPAQHGGSKVDLDDGPAESKASEEGEKRAAAAREVDENR